MPSQNNSKISLPVIKRLPRYYRYVQRLHQQGVDTVSSSGLAVLLGATASQVRQDFNCFGGFGQQGVGYNVQLLAHELENLLFSGKRLPTILLGAGRLGRTIARFIATEANGFELAGVFDNSKQEIGRSLGGLSVLDVATLPDFCRERLPQAAVLCVPGESAAQLAPQLIGLGVKGIWNFSHYDLPAEANGVAIENVHLGDSLSSLGYRVRNPLGG